MAAGAARSAGVAYVDLAVGDTKALVSGISDAVRQAASAAQKSLSDAFNLSGSTDGFKGIVSDAEDAARAAGEALSTSLTDSAKSAATAVGDSITTTVTDAASAAAEALAVTMGEAGRQAGEQLALDFEEASKDIQLGLFSDEQLVTQAGDAGRQAGDALKAGLDESTASLGSAFGMAGLQASLDDAKSAIKNAFTQGTSEGTSESKGIFEEFKQGITYSVGTWSIGMAIGNAITSGVSKALSFVKSSIIDFNSEMQSAQISYGTLLGSDQAGSQMINQIKKFSLSTPFQFEDLVTGSQKLLALGINAKNVIPDLKALGDATSALGGDGAHMNELVQIFGEMQAKGQIMEAQVRELQIRGVPALQILANEYGVSTTQMQEMIKKGKVMASDALPKLVQGIEQGTKSTKAMGDEMQKQSATFKGSMSNLKDGVTQFAAGAFKSVFDSINHVTARLAQFASGGKLDSFVKPIAAAVGKGISDVGRFIKSLIDDLKPAKPLLKDLTDGFGKFSLTRAALSGLSMVVLGIAKAIGEIGKNKTAAAVISSIVLGLITFRTVGSAVGIAKTAITGLIPMVKGLATAMLGLDAAEESNPIILWIQGIIAAGVAVYELYQHSKTFRDIIGSIGSFFKSVWGGIVSVFMTVVHAVESGYRTVAGFLKGMFDSAPVQVSIRALGIVFRIVSGVIMGAVRDIGSVLSWLWHNVFDPVVQGIWFGFRLLATIVGTVLITPFVIAYHLLSPLILGLWHAVFEPAFHGIASVATWLYQNVLQPVFSWIGSLFTGGLSATVMWLWHNVFSPAFQGIGTVANWLWHNVFSPFVAGLNLEFTAASIISLWLWHSVFEPVFHGIATVAMWLWDNAIHPMVNGVVLDFHLLATAATWLWQNAIEPAFHGIADVANWLWTNIISPVFSAIAQAAKWLYDNGIKPTFQAIGDFISKILGDVQSGFKTAISGISTIWSGLEDALKGPLNFIVDTVYTNGIEEVWNFTAKATGVPKLPDVPHYAQGGLVSGSKSAGDWIPIYATAGEGVLTTDEIAALGGEQGFNSFRSMLGGNPHRKQGAGHFGLGGLIGDAWNGIKSVGSSIADGVGDLGKWAGKIVVGGLKGAASDMLKPVLNGIADIMPGGSDLKNLLMSVPKGLINDVLGWFGKKDATAVPNGPATSAQLLQWIQQAMSAAGVSGGDWVNGLEIIVANESGGNPRAINNWDSNAQAGDPSRGLMQTIGSTFEAYRLSSLPDDIYNPVSNIVAGIRYILSRYGSIGNVPGIKAMAGGGSYVGYATGTDGAAKGWAWVGERGPELVNFGGGETVLNHEDSMRTAIGNVGGYASGTLGGAYGRIGADQSWVNGIKDKINELTLESLNAMSKSQRKAIEAEKKVYELCLHSAETSLSQAKSAYNSALRANRTYYNANYKIDAAGGKLTGTTSQIKSATDSLNKLILSMDANSDGMAVIHQDNVKASRLESLSTERAAIEKEIATATKAATTIATKAADYASLSGLHLNSISGAGDIINGLKSNDSQLQTFIRDMNRIKRLGFSSTVVQQIADMGPSSGAAYAEALASASGGQVKQINSLLRQVSNTTTAYGKNVASDIYDTGRNAGRGFLSGLKSQEAAITSEMTRIAGSMVDALKRFLGIRSPSRLVHNEVGLMVGAGLVSGMDASLDDVGSAAERLGVAASSVSVRAPRMAYAGNGTGADGVPVVHVYIDGKEVIDKRVQVQIEENNNALYRALHGGRI